MNFHGGWRFSLLLLVVSEVQKKPVKAINDDGVDDLCAICRCSSVTLDCRGHDLSGLVEKFSTEKSTRKTKIASFAGSTGLNLTGWVSCRKLNNLDVLDLRNTEYDCEEVYQTVNHCKATKVRIYCDSQQLMNATTRKPDEKQAVITTTMKLPPFPKFKKKWIRATTTTTTTTEQPTPPNNATQQPPYYHSYQLESVDVAYLILSMLIIMALGLGVICCVVWRCRRCCCKRSRYRNQLPLHLHDSDDGSETCFDNEQQEGGEGMAMRSTLGAPRKYVNFEKAMQKQIDSGLATREDLIGAPSAAADVPAPSTSNSHHHDELFSEDESLTEEPAARGRFSIFGRESAGRAIKRKSY